MWCCLGAVLVLAVLARSCRGQDVKITNRATCPNTSTTVNGKTVCEGKLIFEDDFDSLDKGRWQNEVRFPEHPDYEFVVYDDSRNNTYIKNGILYLKPTLLSDVYGEHFVRTGSIKLDTYPSRCTNPPSSHQCRRIADKGFRILPPVISSRIRTYNSLKFRYGTVEIRAKMPEGDWIYSQLQLDPRWNRHGHSSSGRIILASVRGNNEIKNPSVSDNRIDFGNRWLEAGVVLDTYNPRKSEYMLAQLSTHGGWNKDFHVYKFTWRHDGFEWSVDGKKLGKGKITPPKGGFLKSAKKAMTPFDEDFFISFGVGVGGIQRFPDDVNSGNKTKPWKNLSPKGMLQFWEDKSSWYPTWHGDDSALQIDYIKIYAL